MDYSTFEQGPAVYLPLLLLSLIVTLVLYGAFPFLFAKLRKQPIEKKKYRRICYGTNLIFMLIFSFLNGIVSNGAPYLLWTWVFTEYGTRVLSSKGLMGDNVYPENTLIETGCKSCGYMARKHFKKCPKCGSSDVQIYSKSNQEKNATNSSPNDIANDEVLKAILQDQARTAMQTMEANLQVDPALEECNDFGLVVDNPIYTLATKSVRGEHEYLERLRTLNGEKITWNRVCSTSSEKVKGLIDMYDTYLPSGELYKTVFINMYGAKTSTKAPEGFVMTEEEKVSQKSISKPLENDTASAIETSSNKKGIEEKKKTPKIIVLIVLIAIIASSALYIDYSNNNYFGIYVPSFSKTYVEDDGVIKWYYYDAARKDLYIGVHQEEGAFIYRSVSKATYKAFDESSSKSSSYSLFIRTKHGRTYAESREPDLPIKITLIVILGILVFVAIGSIYRRRPTVEAKAIQKKKKHRDNGIDVTEEIRKYKKLLDDGIINEEDYEKKKRQLLDL